MYIFCCLFIFKTLDTKLDLMSLVVELSLGAPRGSMSQVVGLPNSSYKHITYTAWVRLRLCKLLKGCTRVAAASDKVYQFLAHGRWFSPGTTASSTTKTGRHDIAKILLKVVLSTKNQIKSQLFVISESCSMVQVEKRCMYVHNCYLIWSKQVLKDSFTKIWIT